MKKTFERIALWKTIDLCIQGILFVVMLCMICCSSWFLFGMYIMGAAHLLSSIIWAFILDWGMPQYGPARNLRKIILFVGTLLVIMWLFNKSLFFASSMYMVFIGPVLGICYCRFTIIERSFYANARKPYYLL
jgi:hypothetical protein